MFPFFRRKKLRRVPLERARPVQRRAIHLVEPSLRTAHVLLGIFFAACLAAICSSVEPGTALEVEKFALRFLICLGLVAVLGAYHVHYDPELLQSRSRVFWLGMVSLLLVGAARLLLDTTTPASTGAFFWALPLTFLPMLVSMFLSPGVAVLHLFAQLLLLGLLVYPICLGYIPILLALLPGTVIAIFGAVQIRHRFKLVKVCLLAGVVHFFSIAVVLALGKEARILTEPATVQELTRQATPGLVNGLATGFLLTGLLPLLERWFGLTTDLRLLELADLNHPLLKRLSLEAPGTYHHSLTLANLAEAAAEEIGANALLCRASAYYHDIGKLNRPDYFTENESIFGSKHKHLAPSMSTWIIIAHVKDGIEMAEYYRLPPAITDFIAIHHGTSVMEFFYQKAVEREGEDSEEKPRQEAFRYPGPRPWTREQGIVMLADPLEAASRTLSDPAPQKIKSLAQKLILKRLLDGQLDQCPLTLQELTRIESSFVRVLAAIHHSRVKYPESPPPKTGAPAADAARRSEPNQAAPRGAAPPQKSSQ